MARDSEENNRIFNDAQARKQAQRDAEKGQREHMDRFNNGLSNVNPGNNRASGGGSKDTGSCFPASARIATPVGLRSIASLSPGDSVISVDVRTGRRRISRVLNTLSYDANRIWEIQFAESPPVYTTSSHSFRIAGKWRTVATLRPGDSIAASTSKGMQERLVSSCRPTERVEPVYNLIVERDFNFIADGALVHSFTWARIPRVLLWSIFSRLSRLCGTTPHPKRSIPAIR